jgi:hypothetical protein
MIKIHLENAGRHRPLLIKLPLYPSTIEELAPIRFWLLKLSQAHFEKLYAYYGSLNPEFLSVLNPRTGPRKQTEGPRKILFHTNKVCLEVSEVAIPEDFAQFICARRITLYTPLFNEPHRNNLFKFITGTGNTFEQVLIYSRESNQGEFCEFLVKVNF